MRIRIRTVPFGPEVCDPVEDDQSGYEIAGVLVTDFVSPNRFAREHALGDIDFKGHANPAFELLTGGYAQKFEPEKAWQQVTACKASRSKRAHAAKGSGRERRACSAGGTLERSRARMTLHRK